MAQDVVINGTTYPAVESVALTDGNGNTTQYYPDAVRHVPQSLTPDQQAQARQNIGAISEDEIPSEAIIDVTELPTENIGEKVFYRLLTGRLVINQLVQNMYTCYCVETLPETGEPATNLDQTAGNVYYVVGEGELYGYVDSMLSMGLGVPAGWYPAATLLGALGYEYAGVITDIMDDPGDNKFRFLLEYVIYSHKDGWTSHKAVGWAGTGTNAEIFNSPSNIASGRSSHAEGYYSHAEGHVSHAEGHHSHAKGYYSHAEGNGSHAEGESSHAEGNASHAEGHASHAEGHHSHAEGYASHAEGYYSHAEGYYSHAEGYYSHAEGESSHAEGNGSHAEGYYSHAEGYSSHAAGRSQHAQGEYNIVDPEYDATDNTKRGKYAHIVGNGTSGSDRSNAHTLDWNGNAWYQGDVFVGGTDQDVGSTRLAKVTELPTKTSDLNNDSKFITASGAPVQSVNGKTGAVQLTASEVEARPSTWTPSATDVGAVSYNAQSLTDTQKAQARENIGAANIIAQSEPPADKNVLWIDTDDESEDAYEALKAEIIAAVIDALGGTPVFGTVDASNNIILTGELDTGTYMLKYEDAEGKVTEIGTIKIGPAYTNRIPTSVDYDDSIFNGTGYQVGKRINSGGTGLSDVSNAANASNPVFVTGFIPCGVGSVVRFKNCYMATTASSTDTSVYGQTIDNFRLMLANESKVMNQLIQWNQLLSSDQITVEQDADGNVIGFTPKNYGAYIRMVLAGDPETAIITVNEEIPD